MSIWTDLLGAEVKYYQAGDWKTRSIEAGSGTPLVMVHGGGGHAEAYAKNIVYLGQFYHVYAIDALGHGLTAKPLDVEVTPHVQAEHVRLFMDAAGIEKAHLAGESMGGSVLGWFAQMYPERALSYTSIVGAGLLPPEGKSEQEMAEMADQGAKSRAALANPTAEGLRPRLEWLFHDPSHVTDELCETRARIWGAPDYQAFQNRPRRGGLSHDYSLWPVLPELGKHIPILFLWTENNPGTHLATAQRIQELTPNSRLEVIEQCGHWPQWEQTEDFHRILLDFLSTAPKA